jgi:putative ATP-dependent endonuclease of OLD family
MPPTITEPSAAAASAAGPAKRSGAPGMYLRTLKLTNFRSCYDTTVKLQPTLTLLVGENNGGKSNVVEALRLATVPLSMRRTRFFEADDRSHGRETEAIELGLEFDGLTEIQRSQYYPALDFDTGRPLYKVRFRPGETLAKRAQPTWHAGKDAGPDSEPEKREQIRHVYLAPLRNAQQELDSANGSRLAFIIEQLTNPADRQHFVALANQSLGELTKHPVVVQTADGIGGHMKALTDPVRGQDVRLDMREYELRRLARSLRLKMAEHGIEPTDLSDSGLGYANLLFIATVVLELVYAQDAELTLFLVEEPEAHLHPQLQVVLLNYLREQAEQSATGDDSHGPMGRIQIIATTHSPNLASSVGTKNVVVLRTKQDVERGDTEPPVVHRRTCALALADLKLKPNDRRKIDQYLDATRAAILFARRIILVEGIAEAVLLPVLARKLVFRGNVARQREFHAVTIVNVGSVDFAPYIRLLLGSIDGLTVVEHLVVITDGDPKLDQHDDDESEAANRNDKLVALAAELSASQRLTVAEATYTLEADLLGEADNKPVLKAAYLQQHRLSENKWDAIAGATNPAKELYRALGKDKKFISKGEFAHDIALAVRDGKLFVVPQYLRDAITGVLTDLGAASVI